MPKTILSLAIIIAFAMPLCAGPQASKPNFFIHNHDRVVFYGDSITDGEWYPTLVQTFILTRYPNWRNEFLNRGQSGDNAGNLERFQRDVVAPKPDAVTFMMGYNDGGYQRLSDTSESRFSANVEKSVQLLHASQPASRMMLISSTPNELTVSSDNRWVSHEWYPYHLLMVSQSEGTLARKLGLPFVDMTTLYGQTMGLGTVIAGPAFALSRDGVHPQQEGQTFIAYHLLRSMGADAMLASTTIDAAKKHNVQAKNCNVSDLRIENGAISFARLCDSLPYPTPEIARPFSFLVQLDDTINSDQLKITGLTAPAYSLTIDGNKIADISSATFAEGINLSRYPNTPIYEQAMKVFNAVRAENVLEHNFWKDYIQTNLADGTGAPKQEASRAAIEAARKRIQVARDYCYTLNVPRRHEFKLEPLDKAVPSTGDAETDLNQSFLDLNLAPVPTDWNVHALNGISTKLHIANPNSTSKTIAIAWQCPTGWTIVPSHTEVEVPAGKSLDIPFTVSAPSEALLNLPQANVQWRWSKTWPYPMAKQMELELAPKWTINRSTQPVTVDGKLDDWNDASSFTLDTASFVDAAATGKRRLWGGPDDLSVKWFTKWDDKALYLAAIVRDSEHIQNETPQMMWSQDMLQVGMYDDSSKPAARYEYGFGAYADRDAVVSYIASNRPADDKPAIPFKSFLDAEHGTCTYEVAIPWERLAPFKPEPGKSFRFTFAICDADSQPGKGSHFLTWTPGLAFGKNPYDMAIVTLGK